MTLRLYLNLSGMKRLLFFGTIAVILSFSARCAMSRFVAGDVARLLALYDLEVSGLECSGGFISREGHCLFSWPHGRSFLEENLDRDLEEGRPKYQNSMDVERLGSGKCRESFPGIEPSIPRTQLGGGSLPYLGRIFSSDPEGRGCVEFEYGYG